MSIKEKLHLQDEIEIKDTDLAVDIKDLTVYYELEEETVKAVNDLTLQIKTGHTLGLVGETGAGKTTTALAMMHLLPDPPAKIKSGTIEVFGNDMIKSPSPSICISPSPKPRLGTWPAICSSASVFRENVLRNIRISSPAA